MKTSIKIEGVEDINNLLSKIAPTKAKNIMRSTVHGMAGEVRSDAKKAMPVDSGDMKRGTKSKRRRQRGTKIASDVVVSGAYYWRFVEYGQGPGGREVAMFMKAVEKLRANFNSILIKQFGKKFEAALKRARK